MNIEIDSHIQVITLTVRPRPYCKALDSKCTKRGLKCNGDCRLVLKQLNMYVEDSAPTSYQI